MKPLHFTLELSLSVVATVAKSMIGPSSAEISASNRDVRSGGVILLPAALLRTGQLPQVRLSELRPDALRFKVPILPAREVTPIQRQTLLYQFRSKVAAIG